MQNYFSNDELKCKCCGALKMDDDFIKCLNAARMIAKIPFRVTSGFRCEAHNEKVGSTSANHTSGKAADIACLHSNDRYLMIQALLMAGMKGIGIDENFIHCDINRDDPVLWLY